MGYVVPHIDRVTTCGSLYVVRHVGRRVWCLMRVVVCGATCGRGSESFLMWAAVGGGSCGRWCVVPMWAVVCGAPFRRWFRVPMSRDVWCPCGRQCVVPIWVVMCGTHVGGIVYGAP